MTPMLSRALLRGQAIGMLLLSACSVEPLSGPPEVKLGRSECAACGMIISEERCSSALLVDLEGRREHRLYDDIGCMLDDEGDVGLEGVVLQRFVHDHDTRAWVEANLATFVLVERDAIPTPMGSGIVAYATREAAERSVAANAGQTHDYPSAAVARRDWMHRRITRPR